MRADGVEVAQKGDGPVGDGLAGVAQDLLAHVFRPAVGIGAHAGVRILAQGHGVVAGIHRGGGGENDVLHAVIAHRLAENDG